MCDALFQTRLADWNRSVFFVASEADGWLWQLFYQRFGSVLYTSGGLYE